jgi:hypothetical protein
VNLFLSLGDRRVYLFLDDANLHLDVLGARPRNAVLLDE